MLRFIVIAIGLALLVMLLMKLARDLRTANVDWQGWGFAAAFVALAFYLRHATGMG